jgi:pantetheine-phosphate adenylyltransferase
LIAALYPGRFDPVTNGHVDIAQRAARLFNRLVIAVYDLPPSQTLFSTQERVDLFRQAVQHLDGVAIVPFKGLVVNFAREQGAGVLVRGIRAVTDFEAELDMALMNKQMAPEIESIHLMASLEHLFVSGHRIREVANLGFDVRGLVPSHVAEALKRKLG